MTFNEMPSTRSGKALPGLHCCQSHRDFMRLLYVRLARCPRTTAVMAAGLRQG